LRVRVQIEVRAPEEVSRPRWDGHDWRLTLADQVHLILSPEAMATMTGYLLAVVDEAPDGDPGT
jgi:hypothetical protein